MPITFTHKPNFVKSITMTGSGWRGCSLHRKYTSILFVYLLCTRLTTRRSIHRCRCGNTHGHNNWGRHTISLWYVEKGATFSYKILLSEIKLIIVQSLFNVWLICCSPIRVFFSFCSILWIREEFGCHRLYSIHHGYR